MKKEIHAKIIKLMSKTQVVINKGKNDGVKIGMIFGIKLMLPDIVDPEDESNVLSGIYYEKGEIRVDSVFDRMSFASLIPKKSISYPSDLLQAISTNYEYPEIHGGVLLSKEAWKIQAGDEVYLKEEKEKDEKK
jgi:hypothetical protein